MGTGDDVAGPGSGTEQTIVEKNLGAFHGGRYAQSTVPVKSLELHFDGLRCALRSGHLTAQRAIAVEARLDGMDRPGSNEHRLGQG